MIIVMSQLSSSLALTSCSLLLLRSHCVKMAISPAEAAYQLAHASQSKFGQLVGSTAALTALATVLVTARFISRTYTKVGLRADDWAILIALILSWGSFVTNVYGMLILFKGAFLSY